MEPYLPASISLVFKSLKPAATFTLSVQPTDSISTIKAQLSSLPSAPPADAQRLLLKGKALQDGKLLKEYNIKDGDTLNIVIKPGLNWNPTAGAGAAPAMSSNPSPSSLSPLSSPNPPPPQPQGFGSGTLNPQARPSTTTSSKGKHTRIPSVVLSPSPSLDSLRGTGVEKDILITLDSDPLPSPQSETLTTFHETVSNPDFWQRLYDFLKYGACY